VATAVAIALTLLAVDHTIERWTGDDRPDEPLQASEAPEREQPPSR
jgi:hypothetical protein